MRNICFRFYHSLQYYLTKKNPINLHSPFLYQLYLKTFRIHYRIPQQLISYQNKLSQCNDSIEFQSIGANKKFIKTKVNKWEKRISTKLQKRSYIIGLAEYFNAKNILELGGGFGKTSAMLSLSLPYTEIYTIEGVTLLNNYITNLKNELNLINLHNFNLDFNTAIDKFIKENKKFELIIVDGSHHYEATINIINQLPAILSEPSIVILDDINYSRNMYLSWKEIIKNNDFFDVKWERNSYGLLIKNSNMSKQFIKI